MDSRPILLLSHPLSILSRFSALDGILVLLPDENVQYFHVDFIKKKIVFLTILFFSRSGFNVFSQMVVTFVTKLVG